MPDRITMYVGQRLPNITEQITSNSTAVDLTSSTVVFKMRLVGSSTLKVSANATIDVAATGMVSYAWAAADVDTAGEYLVWWEVTTSSKVQPMGERILEIRAHAPDSQVYIPEIEAFKDTLELTGTSFADGDLRASILAASRGVDEVCGRRFYADTDANQTRYYSPSNPGFLRIHDLITLTSLKTDEGDDGSFEETWTSASYVLEPLNAAADGKPYTAIRRRPTSNLQFPISYPKSVEVTGKFGWSSTPYPIVEATKIIAAQLLKRKRDAPLGVLPGGFEGTAVYIARSDPQIQLLLEPFVRLDPDES